MWNAVGIVLVFVCKSFASNTRYPHNWSYAFTGSKIDVGNLKLIWSDDFTKYDISTDSGPGPWYAPVHSDYGIGHFATPPDSVYYVNNSIASLSSRNVSSSSNSSEAHWICATMQSMNSQGKGFSCQNCYFEFRAKLPRTYGAWAAMWSHSMQAELGHSEIDLIEYYGALDPLSQHYTIHIWPNSTNDRNYSSPVYCSNITKISSLNDGQFHLHGALLTQDWVVIYYDRSELARIQRAPENQVPHYIILSMAMANQTIKQESTLSVDYVDVYAIE